MTVREGWWGWCRGESWCDMGEEFVNLGGEMELLLGEAK